MILDEVHKRIQADWKGSEHEYIVMMFGEWFLAACDTGSREPTEYYVWHICLPEQIINDNKETILQNIDYIGRAEKNLCRTCKIKPPSHVLAIYKLLNLEV